nr:MAG TPA: dCTP deaminase dUTPase [Caudoviricetes sp.]
MKVTIQKTMNVLDPVRAHDTDAGLDLHVPEGQTCLVRRGAVYTIDLGVRAAIPDGYCGQLALRSSAGAKGLAIPHGTGIIDPGYRGNLKLLVTALTEPVLVSARDRICQLIIHKLPTVEWEAAVVDDDTDRGQCGFGSTGGRADGALYDGEFDMGEITVGKLIKMLESIAYNFGDQVPVVTAANGAHDYGRISAPLIRYANRITTPGSRDAFDRNAAEGDAVVVFS